MVDLLQIQIRKPTHKSRCRWVPLNPNMENPNSPFNSNGNHIQISDVLICPRNANFASFKGFSAVKYYFFELRGRYGRNVLWCWWDCHVVSRPPMS